MQTNQYSQFSMPTLLNYAAESPELPGLLTLDKKTQPTQCPPFTANSHTLPRAPFLTILIYFHPRRMSTSKSITRHPRF